MVSTPIEICNLALAAIAARSSISSFNDQTPESNACAQFYAYTVNAMFRAVHWDFARRQDTLTQLKASTDTNSTCPVPWGYEYAYPSNCMKARYIVPFLPSGSTVSPPLTTAMNISTMSPGFGTPTRFVIATDSDANGNDSTVILTNQPQAILCYTKKITNVNLWDPTFVEAVVSGLAMFLVPALNMNTEIAKLQASMAKSLIDQARVANGNEGPEIMNLIPDWMRVRGAGGYAYGDYFMGWDQFPFPSSYF